jgi:hypothetical protein
MATTLLCDALQLPNLALRSQAWWGANGAPASARRRRRPRPARAGERKWLVAYAPASLAYRLALFFGAGVLGRRAVLAARWLVAGAGFVAWLGVRVALGCAAGRCRPAPCGAVAAAGRHRGSRGAGPAVRRAGAAPGGRARRRLAAGLGAGAREAPPASSSRWRCAQGALCSRGRRGGAERPGGHRDARAVCRRAHGLLAQQYEALLTEPAKAGDLAAGPGTQHRGTGARGGAARAARDARRRRRPGGLGAAAGPAGQLRAARRDAGPRARARMPAHVRLALLEEDLLRTRGQVRAVEVRLADTPWTRTRGQPADVTPGATPELPNAGAGRPLRRTGAGRSRRPDGTARAGAGVPAGRGGARAAGDRDRRAGVGQAGAAAASRSACSGRRSAAAVADQAVQSHGAGMSRPGAAWPFPGLVWGDLPAAAAGRRRAQRPPPPRAPLAHWSARRDARHRWTRAAAGPCCSGCARCRRAIARRRRLAAGSPAGRRRSLHGDAGLRAALAAVMAARALLDERLVEMDTGEGKTAAIALAAAPRALAGTPRARGHRQRLPGAARRRAHLQPSTPAWACAPASSRSRWSRRNAAPPTPHHVTYCTARSSPSTTCATACCSPPTSRRWSARLREGREGGARAGAARPVHGHPRRGRHRADRRGARAAGAVAAGRPGEEAFLRARSAPRGLAAGEHFRADGDGSAVSR